MVHWRELQSITCKFYELGIIYNHLHFQEMNVSLTSTYLCVCVNTIERERERKREKGIQVFSLLLVGPSRLFWEPVINYTNKLMIQKLKNKLSNENLIDTTFQNTSDNNSTNSNKHIQMQLNNENSERVLPAKLLTSTLHFLSPSWNFYCPTFNIALSIYSLLFRGNYQLLDCHKKTDHSPISKPYHIHHKESNIYSHIETSIQ